MPAFFMPVSFARFLPIPLVGYGVSLIFTASLRSLKNGSLAITSFKNDRPVFNTVSYEIFFRAYSRLPLPSANAATFPDKRGRPTVRILFCLVKKSITAFQKRNSPLPSFLSGGQNRNDDKYSKQYVRRSEESGIGYRQKRV